MNVKLGWFLRFMKAFKVAPSLLISKWIYWLEFKELAHLLASKAREFPGLNARLCLCSMTQSSWIFILA